MSEYVQILVALFFYRSLIIIAGLVIIYLGYRLLTKVNKSNFWIGIIGAIFSLVGALIIVCLYSYDIKKTHEIALKSPTIYNCNEK